LPLLDSGIAASAGGYWLLSAQKRHLMSIT
jgi:hypothetical protein